MSEFISCHNVMTAVFTSDLPVIQEKSQLSSLNTVLMTLHEPRTEEVTTIKNITYLSLMPPRPDQHWAPFSSLFNAYWGCCLPQAAGRAMAHGVSPRRLTFDSGPVHVVEKWHWERDFFFLRVRRFSPVNIVPSMSHTHLHLQVG
jgi:hypothetical protein